MSDVDWGNVPGEWKTYVKSPSRPGDNRRFLYRVDVGWIRGAIGLGSEATRVAMALLHRLGLEGSAAGVRLNQHDVEVWNLSRNCRSRGFRRLEAAGLIRRLNPDTKGMPVVEIVLPPIESPYDGPERPQDCA